MTDDEVTAALFRLWWHARWSRLEIGRNDDGYTGYCIDGNREYMTRAVLADPQCPEVITALARLLDDSGWRRLELVAGYGSVGGWCERADGSGLHVSREKG